MRLPSRLEKGLKFWKIFLDSNGQEHQNVWHRFFEEIGLAVRTSYHLKNPGEMVHNNLPCIDNNNNIGPRLFPHLGAKWKKENPDSLLWG